MEELGAAAHRSPPSDRLLGLLSQQPTTAPTVELELSEQDIFSTPSGYSSSPTHSGSCPDPTRSVQNHTRNHYGILAALNDNVRAPSRSDSRPVFNHKACAPVSLSSSSSTSPATSTSSRMMVPRKPPPPPPMRLRHQSAPVNVPVIPAEMRRRWDLEEVVSEDEMEVEEENGVMLPPHELVEARESSMMPPHQVVATRESPMLASSVLEGAGRTLKGRDLRQVRNAIWRKTGFLD